MTQVFFLNSNKDFQDVAHKISNELNIDIIKEHQLTKIAEDAFLLFFEEDKLSLKINNSNDKKPINVDFLSDKLTYRLKQNSGKSEIIAKATALNKIKNAKVIDATAGLGVDSFIMASLGASVVAIERSKIIYQLLLDGYNRALKDDNIKHIIQRISIINDDSYNYIKNNNDEADVIYLDPMFPQRQKSALVKKEMRIFKELFGTDDDSTKLLDISIAKARKRVVVKRPVNAEFLKKMQPNVIYKGKINKFDVYLPIW